MFKKKISTIKKTNDDDCSFYDRFYKNFPKENTFSIIEQQENDASLVSHISIVESSINSRQRKFYYISDIHLDHKIKNNFPEKATFEEISLFIQNFVELLTKDISSFHSYLLIAGDVSFNFTITKLFYSKLSELFTPEKIIAILGNHELWDNSNNTLTIDETIDRYRQMFDDLNITFLHNDIYINTQCCSNTTSYTPYFFDNPKKIPAETFLKLSLTELQNLSSMSNFIIFGTTGFSGNNPIFNANNGIYKNTITSFQEDKNLTHQAQQIYDKLIRTFYNDKTIVLSHMPISDWTTEQHITGWIYVNGHTHYNKYVKDSNYELYADNQVGYLSKNIILKHFSLKSQIDIFKSYTNGIYKITPKEYLTLISGQGMNCNFNLDVDYIHMLKYEKTYMFLTQENDGTLYLLNGGLRKKLKQKNIEYFYDNISIYSKYIKDSLEEYNNYLKNISTLIKKIGGDGYIHGAIIDIDFFNHIYVNPQTGQIVSYFSPKYGTRYEYDDFELFLEKCAPRLYINYQNLLNCNESSIHIEKNKLIKSNNSIIPTQNFTMYKYSNLIKRLHYITENNVIRIWDEKLIDKKLLNMSSLPLIKKNQHKKLISCKKTQTNKISDFKFQNTIPKEFQASSKTKRKENIDVLIKSETEKIKTLTLNFCIMKSIKQLNFDFATNISSSIAILLLNNKLTSSDLKKICRKNKSFFLQNNLTLTNFCLEFYNYILINHH